MELIRRWSPSLIMMVTIFIASSTPGQEMPQFGGIDLLVKKGGHMFGYALLTLAFSYAIKRYDLKGLGTAFSLAVIYAMTDEFHQMFVPLRHATIIDIGIDAIGALVALFVLLLVINILRPRYSLRQ